ncbi:hypothetical protein Tco_1066664 [Tanacetum coccineum]|uniref:Uncharacterized protein n=1 Tax=Tanacetum coccineum TaxID=301880 RepID=A0ABQ5HAQ5_9ASTR
MVEKSKLDEDKEGKAVDPSHYRGMIGTLLYLIASRPDLQFAICMCAWDYGIRRILQWHYCIHFADADLACVLSSTRRSTSCSMQFLGDLLVSLVIKKAESITISVRTMDTTRAEQIALDDALVDPANRLKIGKSNFRLCSDLKSKEATL